MGIVAEATDEMEAVLMDAVIESTCGEECVGNDEVGHLLQFLAVALDDSNVMIDKCHVALPQLKVARCLMGTKHHAVMGIDGFEDGIYFGGYIHNFEKEPVSIYHRKGRDEWETVYTFSKDAINHVHNIIADPYRHCFWIYTGDFSDSAAIWNVSDGFRKVERIVSGDQKWRGYVAFSLPEGLLYATDAPFAKNHIYLLKDDLTSEIVGELSGSCIYGCRWNDDYVFSTVVEPDGRNETFVRLLFGRERGDGIEDNYARIYSGNLKSGFKVVYQEEKDKWPFIFQFGAFRFPTGENKSSSLYSHPIATKKNDLRQMKLIYGL